MVRSGTIASFRAIWHGTDGFIMYMNTANISYCTLYHAFIMEDLTRPQICILQFMFKLKEYWSVWILGCTQAIDWICRIVYVFLWYHYTLKRRHDITNVDEVIT